MEVGDITETNIKKDEQPQQKKEEQKGQSIGQFLLPHDYTTNEPIQHPPTFLNKFTALNHVNLVRKYNFQGITRQKLYKYNDNFQPMFSTTRMLQKFMLMRKSKQQFRIAVEIFNMQMRAIFAVLLLSLIAGGCSVVIIYFQQRLVKDITNIASYSNWTSFGVIVGLVFLRWFVLNYTFSLSNVLALNIKLYLQNVFMRAVFFIDQEQMSTYANRIKYLELTSVGEAIYYFPYLIISTSLIVGILIMILVKDGKYGCITLGVCIFSYICIFISMIYAHKQLKQNSKRREIREKIGKMAFLNLLRLSLENIGKVMFNLLMNEKQKQIMRNRKVTLSYTVAQVFGQSYAIVSIIILASMQHFQNTSLSAADSYLTAFYLMACFYPFKHSVYGLYIMAKAYTAFVQIDAQFKKINRKNISQLQMPQRKQDAYKHVFAQNLGDCFQYQYNKIQQQEQAKLKHNAHHQPNAHQLNTHPVIFIKSKQATDLVRFEKIALQGGQVMMVLTRVDSDPTSKKYFRGFINGLPRHFTAAMINESQFMISDNLKENILLYADYNQPQFKRILQITQLKTLQAKIMQGNKDNQVNQHHIKFNIWHQTRIELARALYNNVDYLVLNRVSILQDLSLLKAVIKERKSKNKITLIGNNIYKHYYELADKILVIGDHIYQIGTYNTLTRDKASLFNKMLVDHHTNADYSKSTPQSEREINADVLEIPQKIPHPAGIAKKHYFDFFDFVHCRGWMVCVASLFIPPVFKYLCQIYIAKITTQDVFRFYIGFGITYLVTIFMRGFILTMYTSIASLKLYKKICEKYFAMNAHQILQLSSQRTHDFQAHIRQIDNHLVMDFQLGQSILIQIVVSMVVLATSQPIYLAVSVPLIFIVVKLNGHFAQLAAKVHQIRLIQTRDTNKFIAVCSNRHKSISKYHRINEFNNVFHAKNKMDVIFDCNVQWIQTGVRCFDQFAVIIMFLIFLIVMIETQGLSTSNNTLVGLGIGCFINLLYLNTFYLKSFRQFQISLVSLTICMELLSGDPKPTDQQMRRFKDDQSSSTPNVPRSQGTIPSEQKFIKDVQSIEWRDVSLNYSNIPIKNINMSIKKGERVVLSGNACSYKQIVLYLLQNNIFDSSQIKGDILINHSVQTQFRIQKLFYLHANPVLPFIGTVHQACKIIVPSLTAAQLQQKLAKFFQIINLRQVFKANTKMESLNYPGLQLFQAFKVIFLQQCKILVIVSGFQNLDIVTRRKLTKYLIQSKQINIIIQTSNLPEIIQLYPKHLKFEKGTITAAKL